MRRPNRLALVLVLLAVAGSGCISRPVKTGVFSQDDVQVFLRGEKRWLSSEVEKDYDHPVTVASVRVAHILSRLDLRRPAKEGNEREAAIPTDLLYTVAEGVSKALERAGPNQEVVAMARRKERSFGIFDKQLLTSFVAYVRDDSLFIHLSRADWEVPERRESDLPEPRIGEHPMKFRLFGGTAMTLVSAQVVAVQWRDPVFSKPTRTRILPTGKVIRKTILLESGEEVSAPAPDPVTAPLPVDLSPETLRALADLEDARLDGEITEALYRVRRRALLAGE